MNKIENLFDDMYKNKLSVLILKNLVIERLQYFNEDYKDKQKISKKLGIPIETQRRISFKYKDQH